MENEDGKRKTEDERWKNQRERLRKEAVNLVGKVVG